MEAQGAGSGLAGAGPGGAAAGLEGLWPRMGSGLGVAAARTVARHCCSARSGLEGCGQWQEAADVRPHQQVAPKRRFTSELSEQVLRGQFRLKMITSNLVAPENCAEWPFTEAGGSFGPLQPPLPPGPWSLAPPRHLPFPRERGGQKSLCSEDPPVRHVDTGPEGTGPVLCVGTCLSARRRRDVALGGVRTAAREPGRAAGSRHAVSRTPGCPRATSSWQWPWCAGARVLSRACFPRGDPLRAAALPPAQTQCPGARCPHSEPAKEWGVLGAGGARPQSGLSVDTPWPSLQGSRGWGCPMRAEWEIAAWGLDLRTSVWMCV